MTVTRSVIGNSQISTAPTVFITVLTLDPPAHGWNQPTDPLTSEDTAPDTTARAPAIAAGIQFGLSTKTVITATQRNI